jgi:mycofactocin system glycosyltransferase
MSFQLRFNQTCDHGDLTLTGTAPGGRFYLKEGIRLINGPTQGFVLQDTPLRVVRINKAAVRILEKCRTGFSLTAKNDDRYLAEMLSFLDHFYEAGILDWIPPENLYQPTVSIVVPVYNRAHDIDACLESLLSLNYPESKREIIIVDDASWDNTAAVVKQYNVRLIIQPENLGQSAARNAGVKVSKGDIIAFIDSDCIADPNWLTELVTYFHDPRLVLIGGYVDSVFSESHLDRYEKVCSPLNMGSKPILGKDKHTIFYVPTCNMLVKKEIYTQAGGLDEKLRVGEDVDLCWKLMSKGYRLMYVPKGRIKHKHRNHFYQCFRRRFHYGTSEAVLYDKYRHVQKKFPYHWEGIFLLVLILIGLTMRSPLLLFLASSVIIAEPIQKKIRLKYKFNLNIALGDIIPATLKHHILLNYHFGYHMARYYLLPVIIISIWLPQVALPLMMLVTLPIVFQYFQKKPRLNFALFALFFWIEQLFYQVGVFWGCLKQGSCRLYYVSFSNSSFLKKKPQPIRERIKSMFRKNRNASL